MSGPSQMLSQWLFTDVNLIRGLVENEGEISPEIELQLEVVKKALPEAIDSCEIAIAVMGAQVDALKQKEKDFREARQLLERSQNRLKEFIKLTMQQTGKTVLKGNDFQFKLQNCRPKLVIDETLVPEQFKTQVITYSVDKDKVADALTAGLDVAGAWFENGLALKRSVNRGDK